VQQQQQPAAVPTSEAQHEREDTSPVTPESVAPLQASLDEKLKCLELSKEITALTDKLLDLWKDLKEIYRWVWLASVF